MALLILFYLEISTSVSAGQAVCCNERHIASVIVQEFAYTGGDVGDGNGKAEMWCRINALPHGTCVADTIFRTDDQVDHYKNNGDDKGKFLLELPKGQKKLNILMTFIDDDAPGSWMSMEQVRKASRHFYERKNYTVDLITDSYWQDEIELNTTDAPYTRSINNRTINGKNFHGGNISLRYSVELNMAKIDKDCVPATEQKVSTVSTTSNPSIFTSTNKRVNFITTRFETNPVDGSSYSNISWNETSTKNPINKCNCVPVNIAVRNILRLYIDDTAEESDDFTPNSKKDLKKRCVKVAIEARCSRCRFEILNLKKSKLGKEILKYYYIAIFISKAYIPIALIGIPSNRMKRQSADTIDNALLNNLARNPLSVNLKNGESRKVIGEKETASKESDSNVIIVSIICGTILIMATVATVYLIWRDKFKIQTTDSSENTNIEQRPQVMDSMKSETMNNLTVYFIELSYGGVPSPVVFASDFGFLEQPETEFF